MSDVDDDPIMRQLRGEHGRLLARLTADLMAAGEEHEAATERARRMIRDAFREGRWIVGDHGQGAAG